MIEIARLPDVVHVARFRVGHVDELEEAVGELRVTGVEAAYEVLDGVDEADTLIAEAARTDAALLALGTHGRQGVARVRSGASPREWCGTRRFRCSWRVRRTRRNALGSKIDRES